VFQAIFVIMGKRKLMTTVTITLNVSLVAAIIVHANAFISIRASNTVTPTLTAIRIAVLLDTAQLKDYVEARRYKETIVIQTQSVKVKYAKRTDVHHKSQF
jgi:hypothetical protein